MNWTTLVSTGELAANLAASDLRLVDARFVMAGADPEAGGLAWRHSHLPGAGYVHLDRDLSDHTKPATCGRHPMPESKAFCALLGRLGVDRYSQVVVYDSGDGAMAAARFWWLMKVLGHARVAVLDGGFMYWQAQQLPVDDKVPSQLCGDYQAQFDFEQIADADELRRRSSESSGWLLDARSPERFRGDVEPIDLIAGHIPGASNRPFSDNLRDGRFKPASELRAEFAALIGAHLPSDVVLYCGSGVTACHNALALEHAGLHGARVFPPSWSGWIADPKNSVS